MRASTAVSAVLALVFLTACNQGEESSQPTSTSALIPELIETALSGEEFETLVDVNENGDAFACLTTEHLLSIDPQCASPEGERENPMLVGAKVPDLVAAIPIGGTIALRLTRTPQGWVLEDWRVVKNFCDDPDVMNIRGADRCS